MAPRGGARCFLAAFATAVCAHGAWGFGEAPKYLIVSAPRSGKIAYLTLPSSGAPAAGGTSMKVLIGSGLTFPQGIAVDQYRKRLFVADPTLNKVVAYDLHHTRDGLGVGKRWTVADSVEVRSVAVDGIGNVFFTDEPRQRIMRITARMIAEGQTTPETVYEAGSVAQVSAPGGITMDNFFVYWLNKASGEQVGTVVRALHEPRGNSSHNGVVSLAANSMKCYGVCLALGNVFYTDENYNLYGIPRAATARHEPVTISSALKEPRGCAFDGDGTVYVADKELNAVYQFASNMQPLSSDRQLVKAADLEGAFGVAVYIRVVD